MFLSNLFGSCRRTTGKPARCPQGRIFRPRLELLEDRTLPAAFYAATASDLIADIRAANTSGGSNSIILTAPTTSPYDLTAVDNLTDGPTGLPVIAAGNNLTIVGNGDTIERSAAPGTPSFRLLAVASGATLTLQNLTLQYGMLYGSDDAPWPPPMSIGGAINNRGNLILSGVTVQNNWAHGQDGVHSGLYGYGGDAAGGGIATYGALTLRDGTRIQNNRAVGGVGVGGSDGGNAFGGGVYVGGGTAILAGVTLSGNFAYGGNSQGGFDSYWGSGGSAFGGGLYVYYDQTTVELRHDIVQNNQAFEGLGRWGDAKGGGIFVATSLLAPEWSGWAYLDTFTVSDTINNFAGVWDPNISGPYALLTDDPVPALAIRDVSTLEGNSGTTASVFTVSLSSPRSQIVTVNYATAAGSAIAGSDYQAVSGTLTFAPGETSKTISVQVNGDRLGEPNETFFVNLTSPSNVMIPDGQGQGTILDDEPRLSINDVTMKEGDSGVTAFAFTVSLAMAYDVPVTLGYATADGTATAGSDYTASSGMLTIPAGQTSGTVTVLVSGDRLGESDEYFFVNLSNLNYGTLAGSRGFGTIVDDDRPHLSIDYGPVVVTEGNTGTTNAEFTVRLSAAYDAPVSVSFSTAEGDTEWYWWSWDEPPAATSDSDFQAASSTLTFAPGETEKTIQIAVNGDRLGEPDEYFSVNLIDSTSAPIDWGHAVGIIVDDEPHVFIDDASALEGNTGTTPFTFTVTLSAASDVPVTVDYATADGSATLAGGDYQAASGTLTFAVGETSKTITVPVNGDALYEPDESFFINLTSPTNAEVANGSGTGIVQNDDPMPPSAVITDVSVTEGNAGTVNATFTVSLSAAYSQPVTIHYQTANGSATAGSDYTGASGDVTFGIGETAKTITITVLGDRLAEPTENFVVNLSAPINATIADGQATATIFDDEPRISINDVTVIEGNTGTVNATFTVSLSVAYDVPVTVHYQTANGSATAGGDYAAASEDVTITAGQTTKTVAVAVLGDRSAEPTENFVVNLGVPTNGLIVDNQGVGTIMDDEPRISISDVTKLEGKNGKTLFVFTVALSAAYDQAVTMSFKTVDGTAKMSESDYVAKTGALTFASGETTKTITIEVTGDSKKEANETFYVDLFGNTSNSLFTKNRGIGTILNDD